MAKLTYNLEAFDSKRAGNKEMCIMVSADRNISTLPTIDYYTELEYNTDQNAGFYGLGVCNKVEPNKFLFTVDSVTYSFDSTGGATSLNARGKKLVMGSINEGLKYAGNDALVVGRPQVTITRSSTTSDSVQVNPNYTVNSAISVTDLKARDEFANQALRSIMQRVEKDPSTISDNEMHLYCQAAYKWAAHMIQEAARARTVGTVDAGASSEVPVTDLGDNTEKLLFDIKTALQRTDKAPYWHYEGSDTTITTTTVVGDHTNAVAATLPHGVHATYTSVAEAEADGWVWNDYSESVTIKNDAEHPLYINTTSSGNDTVKVTNTAAGAHLATTVANEGTGTLAISGSPSIGNAGLGSTTTPLNVSANSTTEVKNPLDSNNDPIPLAINGTATVDIGSFGLGSSANNPLYISGGGGSGGNGTVKIVDGSNNTLGVTGNPLVISGGGSGGGSFDGKIQNATGTTLEISSGTFFGNASVSGSFASVFANKMNDITNGGATSLADVVNAINNISGGGGSVTKSETDGYSSSAGTVDYVTIFASDTNSLYKLSIINLASELQTTFDTRYERHLNLVSQVGLPNSTDKMVANTYYRVTGWEVEGPVNCYLPDVTDTSKPTLIMACFQTSSSSVTLTVSAPTGVSVRYRGAKPTLEASTRYEMDFVYNGLYWIVGATKLVDN